MKPIQPWVKQSIIWSVWMSLCMSVLFPLFSHEEISLQRSLTAFLVFTPFGFLFGYFFVRKRTNKKLRQ